MQEQTDALPAGAFIINDVSSDDEEYHWEQKEIDREMQELRAAQHWVNQREWNLTGEGHAVSPATGNNIDLNLNWDDVRSCLAQGSSAQFDDVPALVDLKEAIMDRSKLMNIDRSKVDLWWTESCLRLLNFDCTKD